MVQMTEILQRKKINGKEFCSIDHNGEKSNDDQAISTFT